MPRTKQSTALATVSTGESSGVSTALASLYASYRDSRHTTPVKAVAFWLAVVLPFVHLALLATGPSGQMVFAYVGLLLLNTVAVVAGQSYRC